MLNHLLVALRKCIGRATFDVDRSNHAFSPGSEHRHDNFRKRVAGGREISWVVAHILYNNRHLLLDSRASEAFAYRKLGVCGSARSAPGDDRDELGSHVINADPTILTEHLDSLGKPFCFGRTIVTTRCD